MKGLFCAVDAFQISEFRGAILFKMTEVNIKMEMSWVLLNVNIWTNTDPLLNIDIWKRFHYYMTLGY